MFTFSLFLEPLSWYLIIFMFLGSRRWGCFIIIIIGYWGSYGLKQRNSLKILKITLNLPFCKKIIFNSLSHNFNIHKVCIHIYWGFSGVRGEVPCKSFIHWGTYGLKQGNPLQNFKNRSQVPILFYFISFFGSLSHYFKVHKVYIWLYWGYYGVEGDVFVTNCWLLGKIRSLKWQSLAKI